MASQSVEFPSGRHAADGMVVNAGRVRLLPAGREAKMKVTEQGAWSILVQIDYPKRCVNSL